MPPKYVPTRPVAAVMSPKEMVASPRVAPRTRTRKVGIQKARPPAANVAAA